MYFTFERHTYYKDYLLNYYNDIYPTNKFLNAGRAAYIERNFHMIDKTDVCTFYSNKTYFPPYKQISNNHFGYSNKKVQQVKVRL